MPSHSDADEGELTTPAGRKTAWLSDPTDARHDESSLEHLSGAQIVDPGSEVVRDEQRIYARDLEVPSAGSVAASVASLAFGIDSGRRI